MLTNSQTLQVCHTYLSVPKWKQGGMKCLDNEEKSECSQVVKLKLKLICFTSAWSHFAKVRDERAFTSIQNKSPYSWKVQVGLMNSSEKNYHFK